MCAGGCVGAIVCVCKYCISKPYPLRALCIFFPAARNQRPPPHPPGTVGPKRPTGHHATTLLPLCYHFATTYATTWPQEATRTLCYNFAITLLQLMLPPGVKRPPASTGSFLRSPAWRSTRLTRIFFGISWNESPPQPSKHKRILILVLKFRSFNRELSPKSRLKKHPLDGDFLAMWGNASPPQPSKHKQILILVKIVWALKQRHNELYENNFIVSNPPFLNHA